MVPAILDEKYIIRFCANSIKLTSEDILEAWNIIRAEADFVLNQDEFGLRKSRKSPKYFSKKVSFKLSDDDKS